MISIVIPARNAVSTLPEQLLALCGQIPEDTEVLVADNGSDDGTTVAAESFKDRLLNLRVIDAGERLGPAAARNQGAAAATGSWLAFIDADDVVLPSWWRAVARLAGSGITFATGPMIPVDASNLPGPSASGAPDAPTHMGFLRYAGAANLLIGRQMFADLGGFAEDLRTGEDVDLSWRAQLVGHALTFDREMKVAVRRRETFAAALKQYFHYGKCDPVLYKRFRPRGLPVWRFRPTLRSYLGLAARLPLLFLPDTRLRWAHQAGRRAGRIAGSISARSFYP